MNYFFYFLLLNSCTICAQKICAKQKFIPSHSFSICNDNEWNLVFNDEFNGEELDTKVWQIRPWAEGAMYGNNGNVQEYNSLDNAKVSGGTLKIISDKKTVLAKAVSWKPDNEILSDGLTNLREYNFTSSNIWTKQSYLYGKLEARVKVPKGRGLWPAFWLYGGGVWNELDVFEFWNENNIWGRYSKEKNSKILHTNVWYDYNKDGKGDDCGRKYKGTDFSIDFHVYTLVWEKYKIEWYVDEKLIRAVYKYYTPLGKPTECELFSGMKYLINEIYPNEPMSIVFNTAIQNGKNSPDFSTNFPCIMEIDWIRYYQKEENK
jgi:beta-glucanase (GH16 family)